MKDALTSIMDVINFVIDVAEQVPSYVDATSDMVNDITNLSERSAFVSSAVGPILDYANHEVMSRIDDLLATGREKLERLRLHEERQIRRE